MTKKELEKRLQEIRDYFGDLENFDNIETEYLELVYDLGDEYNEGEEE